LLSARAADFPCMRSFQLTLPTALLTPQAPPASAADPSTPWGTSTLAPRAADYLLTAPSLDALWAAVRRRAVAAPSGAGVDGDDNDGDVTLSQGVLDYEAYRQVS
jgi:hypothetical protein